MASVNHWLFRVVYFDYWGSNNHIILQSITVKWQFFLRKIYVEDWRCECTVCHFTNMFKFHFTFLNGSISYNKQKERLFRDECLCSGIWRCISCFMSNLDKVKLQQLFFLKNFLEDFSPLFVATDTSVLDFWWVSSGFQSQSGQPYLHFAEMCM